MKQTEHFWQEIHLLDIGWSSAAFSFGQTTLSFPDPGFDSCQPFRRGQRRREFTVNETAGNIPTGIDTCFKLLEGGPIKTDGQLLQDRPRNDVVQMEKEFAPMNVRVQFETRRLEDRIEILLVEEWSISDPVMTNPRLV